jgi:hypothetical protein
MSIFQSMTELSYVSSEATSFLIDDGNVSPDQNCETKANVSSANICRLGRRGGSESLPEAQQDHPGPGLNNKREENNEAYDADMC